MKNYLLSSICCLLCSITTIAQQRGTIGKIEVFDPAFHAIADTSQAIEVLADELDWAEGPIWVKEHDYLLCSDPKRNTIYQWLPNGKFAPFIYPSGYTGVGSYSSEPGSNGLLINQEGELVACEHGDRRISRMNLRTGEKITIADSWQGKRFNSPNDICQHSDGSYYFTDPPYGLPGRERDVATREIGQEGVYKVSPDGQVEQIISDLERPNGIALSPDESVLYVALSNGEKPYLMAYPLQDGNIAGSGSILFNFETGFLEQGAAADGIKVDADGRIYMAAGKGVVVIDQTGKLLGRFYTGVATANCAFGADNWLYITASNYLLRVQLGINANDRAAIPAKK